MTCTGRYIEVRLAVFSFLITQSSDGKRRSCRFWLMTSVDVVNLRPLNVLYSILCCARFLLGHKLVAPSHGPQFIKHTHNNQSQSEVFPRAAHIGADVRALIRTATRAHCDRYLYSCLLFTASTTTFFLPPSHVLQTTPINTMALFPNSQNVFHNSQLNDYTVTNVTSGPTGKSSQ